MTLGGENIHYMNLGTLEARGTLQRLFDARRPPGHPGSTHGKQNERFVSYEHLGIRKIVNVTPAKLGGIKLVETAATQK